MELLLGNKIQLQLCSCIRKSEIVEFSQTGCSANAALIGSDRYVHPNPAGAKKVSEPGEAHQKYAEHYHRCWHVHEPGDKNGSGANNTARVGVVLRERYKTRPAGRSKKQHRPSLCGKRIPAGACSPLKNSASCCVARRRRQHSDVSRYAASRAELCSTLG